MRDLLRRLIPRGARNWLRQPRRSASYLLDRLAYARGTVCQVQMRDDWDLRCHPASVDHFEVFSRDPMQKAELDSFISYCRPGMQLLDIGAHYGLFSLAAARYGGESVRVVSVEASSKAAAILQANVQANGVCSQIEILNVAMGGSDGFLQMLSTGPAGSDYFVSAPDTRPDTRKVRQLSLQTAIAQTGLTPTHVKIDVEGFESEVILTGIEVLQKYQPIIFLELHGPFLRARGKNPANIIDALREGGYHRFEENNAAWNDADFIQRKYECRVVCIPVP